MVNVVIALTIATIKASLVALFFMHLIHDKVMNSIILVSSFIFLGVFVGFTYADQATRDDLKPQGLKVKAPVVAGAPGAAVPGTVDPGSIAPPGMAPAAAAPATAVAPAAAPATAPKH